MSPKPIEKATLAYYALSGALLFDIVTAGIIAILGVCYALVQSFSSTKSGTS